MDGESQSIRQNDVGDVETENSTPSTNTPTNNNTVDVATTQNSPVINPQTGMSSEGSQDSASANPRLSSQENPGINQGSMSDDEPVPINNDGSNPELPSVDGDKHKLDIVKQLGNKAKGKAMDLKNWGQEKAVEAKDGLEATKRMAGEAIGKNSPLKSSTWKKAIKTAVPKTLRGGARLTGAAVGAGIGLAAGIASGDPNTTLKNVGLGMTAGNSIGTGIANGMSNVSDNYKEAKVDYEKERYGDKYDEHKLMEANKKFIKDSDARKFYARKFSTELNGLSGKAKKEKLDEIMNDACKYRNEGVTDNEMIAKAMQLKGIDNTGNRASGDRIAAAMIATKSKDRKAVNEYKEDLNKCVDNGRANKITDGAMKLAGFSLE